MSLEPWVTAADVTQHLDVVNAGPLSLGVSPLSILLTTIQRKEPLARLFPDLKLMERENIHQRVDDEIHPKQVQCALQELIERGDVRFEGNNRWRRYWAVA